MSERVIGGTASAAEASGINGGGGGKKDAMQWRRREGFVTPQTLTKLIRRLTLPVDKMGSGKLWGSFWIQDSHCLAFESVEQTRTEKPHHHHKRAASETRCDPVCSVDQQRSVLFWHGLGARQHAAQWP